MKMKRMKSPFKTHRTDIEIAGVTVVEVSVVRLLYATAGEESRGRAACVEHAETDIAFPPSFVGRIHPLCVRWMELVWMARMVPFRSCGLWMRHSSLTASPLTPFVRVLPHDPGRTQFVDA